MEEAALLTGEQSGQGRRPVESGGRAFGLEVVDAHFATLNDVVNHYDSFRGLGLSDDEKAVAELGVDPAFFDIPQCPKPGDPYILTVSTLHPHKNVVRGVSESAA